MTEYKKKEEISLEDVLEGNKRKAQALISEIEKEEAFQRKETVDDVKRDILMQKEILGKKKNDFINELRGGLGETMKKDPSSVKIIKKTFRQRLKAFFKKIFTKF